MTAGNDGTSTPEDDDPFGYLYADGQSGAAESRQGGYGYPGPAAQPGVPRTSYNQVRTVGERRYGQGQQGGGYGYPGPAYGQEAQGQQGGYAGYAPPQQGAPGTPNPHYAAPETQPGGAVRRPGPSGGRGTGRGRGPNTRGLLIGAVAVVAAVVIGITVALVTSNGGDDDADNQSGAPDASSSASAPSPAQSQKTGTSGSLPGTQDAADLQLGAPAAAANTVQGAQAKGGVYVSLPSTGASVTWKVDAPSAGRYTLLMDYGVDKDATMSLFVDDGDRQSINMKNYAGAPAGSPDKGWTHTYNWITLDKGSNTIKISCEAGDQCGVNLDQVTLKSGQVSG